MEGVLKGHLVNAFDFTYRESEAQKKRFNCGYRGYWQSQVSSSRRPSSLSTALERPIGLRKVGSWGERWDMAREKEWLALVEGPLRSPCP